MRRRNGFAILMAIALLAIVGMAIISVSSVFAAQIRRTRDTQADAQIRQLLLAAAPIASERLGQWDGNNGQPMMVDLPPELADCQLSIRFAPGADGDATVDVQASIGKRQGFETLRYAHRGAGWELTSATSF